MNFPDQQAPNMLPEKSGEIANEEADPKQKQRPVVDVTHDGNKV